MMWSTLFVLVLAAPPTDAEALCQELSGSCQTGTLLFSQGDCLAVKVFSGSRFTHCGAVVVENGRPMVYDSMNGPGVRKTELGEYLRLQTPTDLQVVHPAEPFTTPESDAFSRHLRGQLGRAYGIQHHFTGRRAAGVHCAEYLTDALIAAGKIEADKPPRVSPGSLFEGLTEHRIYATAQSYDLAPKASSPPADESWCRWAWRSTCECTTGCCRQLSRWFCCREK